MLLSNKTMLIYHRNIDRKRRYENDNGDDERTDVIVKVGNKWKVKGKKVNYPPNKGGVSFTVPRTKKQVCSTKVSV